MTDLQRFVELYRSFGIECVVVTTDDALVITLSDGGHSSDGMTESEKFDGYGGFYTSIHFGLDGKFIEQGFWE